MSDRPDEPSLVTEPLPSPGAVQWAISADGSGPAAPAPEDGDEPDPDDQDLLNPQWSPPRRISRTTVLLAGGLVAALGFVGGVLVQKSHDAGLTGGAARAGAAARAFARSGGSSGFGGFGGPADQAGGGGSAGTGGGSGSGSRGSAGTGDGAGGDSGPPVVVGKVVSVGSGTLVVQNFAGTKVTVRVPPETPVTTSGLIGLRPGATVSVTGTKASDGTVNASSVTGRRLG
jgi:hypothetical protein